MYIQIAKLNSNDTITSLCALQWYTVVIQYTLESRSIREHYGVQHEALHANILHIQQLIENNKPWWWRVERSARLPCSLSRCSSPRADSARWSWTALAAQTPASKHHSIVSIMHTYMTTRTWRDVVYMYQNQQFAGLHHTEARTI